VDHAAIHEQLTDKKFGDITTKRSQQAQTFAIMRKSVKVYGEDVSMQISKVATGQTH
jgi:hypothetical protein